MPVSLVLPCYNPQPAWEKVVFAGWQDFQHRVGEVTELVLVLDGDSPGITEAALAMLEKEIPTLKVIRYPQNKGKGYATRKGVEAATGDIILYTDVDFPYTTDSMWRIYQSLRGNECDIAIGVKDDAYYANVPAMRRLISKALRFFISVFLSMPITDTQCGLKGFNRRGAAVFMATRIDRYLFDLEFVYKSFQSKQYGVKAIPVALKENVRFRPLNYSILLPELITAVRFLLNKNR